MYWALTRDHFRRSTSKGVVDPENRHGEKIYYDGCADRLEKDEHYRQQMVITGDTKAELQSWDTEMREGLGDDTEYHQPRRLREQIHLGRLNIKQTEGHTLPVKQHHEYQLAVKIVKERKPRAGRTKNTPIFFVVVSMGWLVDEFVVGEIVAMERIIPRLPAKSWSASHDPQKAATRAEGKNTHTAHLFLDTLSLVAFTATFVGEDFRVYFPPLPPTHPPTVVQVTRTDMLGTL